MNSQTHLQPLSGPLRRRPYIVYDIESKDGDSQNAGFTRPFMVGAFVGSNVWQYDRTEYCSFRNEVEITHIPWDEKHLQYGGCVDRFMRWILEELPVEIESLKVTEIDGTETHPGFIGLIVYAHNGGSFDHLHILPWLRIHMDEYEFEVVPVQSSIQEMQVKRRGDKKPSWFFRDSMKLLPMGLEKACKSFGVQGKLDHSLELHEDNPLWDSYLRQDCMALDSVMEKVHELVENKLGGSVGMTAPSTSMNLFRRKYLQNSIPRHVHFAECTATKEEECSGCCQEFFRRAYYGGRTELFRMEGEGLHYYDINSSYVAALCEPMPVGPRFVDSGKIDWRMRENGWVGFAECEVEIPGECPIPPLPFKHENGKLMFPAGRFHGSWDVSELALLEHPRVNGKILSVGRVVWIQAKEVFRDMMLELYSFRDKARPDFDEGLSLLSKLLGNGLYGKFGQKKDRTQIVFGRAKIPGECFLCGGKTKKSYEVCKSCIGSKPAGDIDNDVWYRHKIVDAQYIMPQISAHVTALARIKLFQFDQEVLDKGGRLYMNDTDSLITDVEMETSTELGALKDEYPGELLRYMGIQPKVYIIEKMSGDSFDGSHLPECLGVQRKHCKGCAPWKVAMKGFPREVRTKENLIKLRDGLKTGESANITFSRLEKVRSMAQRGFKGSPKMVKVEKSFRSDYDKREIISDGDTRAVILEEDG